MGVSSSSFGVARSGAQNPNGFGGYLMPNADFFRVEEFVNYHRHDLPLPHGDQAVSLDVQAIELDSGKQVLQFGITTRQLIEDDQRLPPLNVVLVIDDSGSMKGDKMAKLKESLRAFVGRFRKSDRISIVGFDHEARLILPATEKTRIEKIRRAIDTITADGGTNLHAGLMMGYREALKNFDEERTNRVIFLTDGNANVGETDSAEIAAESKRCIDKGISLVTIGLGVDFNNGLLREIADSGRGLMHYIGDSKDIKKTFVKEIESLLAPAATKVQLKIETAGSRVDVFGYDSRVKQSDGKLVVNLDDLNCNATQVVLTKFSKEELSGKATLKYVDAITKKKITLDVDLDDLGSTDSADSIKRNYAISKLAWGLKSAAKLSSENEPAAAAQELESALEKCQRYVDPDEDKHVERVAKIVRDYLSQLSPQVASHQTDSDWGAE